MTATLFDKLCEELNRAKKENPALDANSKESEPSKLLEKSIIDDGRPGFDHGSHNSHGDWGKHWAHGSYEDEESPQVDPNIPKP